MGFWVLPMLGSPGVGRGSPGEDVEDRVPRLGGWDGREDGWEEGCEDGQDD